MRRAGSAFRSSISTLRRGHSTADAGSARSPKGRSRRCRGSAPSGAGGLLPRPGRDGRTEGLLRKGEDLRHGGQVRYQAGAPDPKPTNNRRRPPVPSPTSTTARLPSRPVRSGSSRGSLVCLPLPGAGSADEEGKNSGPGPQSHKASVAWAAGGRARRGGLLAEAVELRRGSPAGSRSVLLWRGRPPLPRAPSLGRSSGRRQRPLGVGASGRGRGGSAGEPTPRRGQRRLSSPFLLGRPRLGDPQRNPLANHDQLTTCEDTVSDDRRAAAPGWSSSTVSWLSAARSLSTCGGGPLDHHVDRNVAEKGDVTRASLLLRDMDSPGVPTLWAPR